MKKLFQIFCLILTTGLFAQTNFIENKTPSTKRVILLDAGHGGTDTGVKKDELLLALGWLIKEDKVSAKKEGRTEQLYLK